MYVTVHYSTSQDTTVYYSVCDSTLQYITGYYSILQYFRAIYMYPAIMQLTNLFPVGTAVAGCVIGWSHTAHPQTPGTHCSAPSPWHPQGPMGLSPDGWSSSTHHRLQPSPPYQLPCAQRESIEFPEYRAQCTQRGSAQNINHNALKRGLYKLSDMISIVWPKTPCSNPASLFHRKNIVCSLFTHAAWDTRAGGIHESTICAESQAEVARCWL